MNSRMISIAVAFAAGALIAPQAIAQSDPGEAQFHQKCQVCHVLTQGGVPGPLAPNLRGIVGRKAASTAFKVYSPALKSSGLTWTPSNLDRFLSGPGKMVPGTRMVISIPDAKQRSAVIAFLARQH